MCYGNLMLIPLKTGPKPPKSMGTRSTGSFLGDFFPPCSFTAARPGVEREKLRHRTGQFLALKPRQAWKGVTSQTFSMLCPTPGAAPAPGKLQFWEAPNPPGGSGGDSERRSQPGDFVC